MKPITISLVFLGLLFITMGATAVITLNASLTELGNLTMTASRVPWIDATGHWALAVPSDVNDTAYSSAYNGKTDEVISANAVYDYLHQIDTDDDGEADKLNPRAPGVTHHWTVTFNPDDWYQIDVNLPLDPNTDAALTITKVEAVCDANPATELDWDLYFANVGLGAGSQTLIGAIDTTAGVANIKTFSDATVPANKKVYIKLADPDDAIKRVTLKVTWDYD